MKVGLHIIGVFIAVALLVVTIPRLEAKTIYIGVSNADMSFLV
jgi:hypothetical protein